MKFSEIAQRLRPYVIQWIDEILGSREWTTSEDVTWIQGTSIPTQDITGNRGVDSIDLQKNRTGANMIASGDRSALVGGEDNTAGGDDCGIFGGQGSSVGGDHSVILGGQGQNLGSTTDSAILGGFENYLESDYCAALAGYNNSAYHDNCVVMGKRAASHSPYGFYIGNVETTEEGDAQSAVFVMREEIAHSDSDWHDLYLTGTTAISVPSDSVMVFEALLAGTTVGCTKSFGFKIIGVIENDGGTTSILGTPTVTTLYDTDDVSFDAQAAANDASDTLRIQVKDDDGGSDSVIWAARVQTAEVKHITP